MRRTTSTWRFSWNIDKNFTLYAGCNNIFDRDPPILSSAIAGPPFGNGNTYPQVYDTLGSQSVRQHHRQVLIVRPRCRNIGSNLNAASFGSPHFFVRVTG